MHLTVYGLCFWDSGLGFLGCKDKGSGIMKR